MTAAKPKSRIAPAAAFLALALAGCGQKAELGVDPAETACPARIASIGVGDGYLQRICGCDEPSGQLFLPTSTLTCTVPLSTTVIFHFLATHGLHQIRPVGTPQIPSSPISDPGASEIPVRAYAVRPDATGTYRFADVTDSSIAGRLVIR